MKIPFSAYDFFGCLATGFIVLCANDHASGLDWLQREKIPPGAILFLTVATYVVGHAVAHLSSFVIEHLLVRGVLRAPEDVILDKPQTGWWRKLFPIYYKPLPEEIRDRILKRAKADGFDKPGRALFFHCFEIAKHDKATADRLGVFLNIYGFCRNACMAGLIAATILAVTHNTIILALVTLGLAVVLLYRYLKFFKHYTEEVFRFYSVAPDKLPADGPKQEKHDRTE